MAAYLIGRMSVIDPSAYAEYKKRTPALVEKFGGRFLVRGGKKVTLEGPEERRRVVVVEFPSLDEANRFYYSPEYQAAIRLRKDAAADMELVVVEGFESTG